MQIVIDIPEEVKNRLCFGVTYLKDIQTVCEALKNGIPIPDNATNGDVIKAIFDEEDIWDIQTALNLHTETIGWWNSPYQKGGKE